MQPGSHFIAAVSGGIDSVVLCELCHQARFNFSIAHCNFTLRGEESSRDEDFVRGLGTTYGVAVFVKHFDTTVYAAQEKMSIQEAARVLRYQWFEQLKNEIQAACTLLAHHANDNIETVLMNFFRGTGLEGLTGMSSLAVFGGCLRPLLKTSRKDIEDFAKEYNLDWVEDSSNSSDKYTRNYFRNSLIPAIQQVYPQTAENILDNIDRFTKIVSLYKLLVADVKQKLIKSTSSEVRIPVQELIKYEHTALLYEIIKEYGFKEKQVGEVAKLVYAESGKYIENESHQIIKHRNWLIIAPKNGAGDTVVIEKGCKQIYFGGGLLEIKTISAAKLQINKTETLAQLDAGRIEFPLLIRNWKEGDYFYPLGMRKKKKLSRFFIDRKLSKHQKEKIWVVESANRLIWVVSYRIDDRFKITEKTKEVLELSISSP